MNIKNKMRIFLSLFVLIGLAGFVCAEQQGNLPVDYIQDRTAKQLRMVDGGLCGSTPDDAGTTTYLGFQVWCTGKNGVTSDLTGCVALYFDENWKVISDVAFKPGAYVTGPNNAAYWQRYNCYDVPYTCTDFTNGGCGAKGQYVRCDDDEMLRVRTCSENTPASVETERCIPWGDCRDGTSQPCEYKVTYGDCVKGKQKITYQYEDCSKREDTQNCVVECRNPGGYAGDTYCSNNVKLECNSYGNWVNIGTCGGGGGTSCTDPDGYLNEIICNHGFERTCTSSGWTKGNPCTVVKDIKEISTTAFYDPTKNVVIGRVTIKNNGDDMKDTYIMEMQVRKKGTDPLAFMSEQKTCDPEHPENVHKQFMLKRGEEITIELEVPEKVLGRGEFDAHFMSRHKCYKDLTQEQIENHDEYQRVAPFPTSKKITGIKIGNPLPPIISKSNIWIGVGWVLAAGGIILSLFGLFMFGIPAFAIGILILVWQYLL